MKRKICVITGTRADYGIWYPMLRAIQRSKSLELSLIVTGMHLMKEFGATVREIEKDGFDIYERVNISYRQDTGQAMAVSVGKAVVKFTGSFTRLCPDVVMVLGDRGEMFAAAIAANYLNITVAHLHGGEISGHIDGVVRHTITKLAHVHFPATKQSRERILKLGEEPWRVFVVGAPALDRILHESLPNEGQLVKKYAINKNKPLALLIQHPVLSESDRADDQMGITLDAITELKLQTMLIYPNADAGGRMMIKVIRQYESSPFIKTFRNIPHQEYLGLMKIAEVLVGNSSSGIVEAPSFKLPVVNIGIRQEGRERSTNVIDVPHDKGRIMAAVKKAIYDNAFRVKVDRCKNPYGDGQASKRIVKVLSEIEISERLLHKQMTY